MKHLLVQACSTFFVFICGLFSLVVSHNSIAALPDPENELNKLSSIERISISAHCQTYTTGVAAYRKCVWDELKTLGCKAPFLCTTF